MIANKPKTIGELQESGYQARSVKEELRQNLIRQIRQETELFPGIIGYEDSVIPQVENAILSGQDIIFLGERGQAKSRMIRSLVNLLDQEIPVIAGCEIHDNPFKPICKNCRLRVDEEGPAVEIAWLTRENRYGEKLATPDVTIADLIGEVDPIKVAEGRYLSDELTIHYGLIPRTNRGIFAINELPDLAEKIQVGLFNIMEERDVQIRGYRVRLPLDVYVVASANPEDYTNRGRIITPLKDRYGSQIRTHYPKNTAHEIDIMDRERTHYEDEGLRISIPAYIKEILAEFTSMARRSPDINQRSGVSVRVSITNYENVVSNAIRRAIRNGETYAAPRISDLPFIIASTTGKIELETVDEGKEDQIVDRLLQGAVTKVFNRHFDAHQFEDVVTRFKNGLTVDTSDIMRSEEYAQKMRELGALGPAMGKLESDRNPATLASAMEFILEGLHLNKKLNKTKVGGRLQYRG